MKWVNQRKTDVEYYLVCGFVYKIWIKENTILNTKNGDMMTIQTASETSGRNRKIEETFVQHDKRKNKRIKLGKCFKDDTSTPQWNWLKLVPASSGLFYFDTTAPRKKFFYPSYIQTKSPDSWSAQLLSLSEMSNRDQTYVYWNRRPEY